MPIAVSARYLDIDFPNDLSLDQKIEVFGDRVLGWQLQPAQVLSEVDPNSGFAVLHIVMSYFETVAKFRGGFCRDGSSKIYFKRGFQWFLRSLQLNQSQGIDLKHFDEDKFYDYIYHQVRCGLYHASMTGVGIFVTGEIEGILQYTERTDGRFTIDINPKLIVVASKQHFLSYLRALRDSENVDLRTKFEARFDWIQDEPL